MKLLTNYKEVKNEEKNGIELYFDSIPTEEERTELKENGYRWNRAKKCWYKRINSDSLAGEYTYIDKQIEEGKNPLFAREKEDLKALKKLDSEEVKEVAKKLYNTPKMQEFIIDKYEFYKTSDGLILELEKVNKISITKELYYYDDTEDPGTSENVFLSYNRYNVPGRNLEEYLKEKENLQNNGCASGRYDYKGIYFTKHYYNNDEIVACGWADEKDDRFFIRYLTEEETSDFIQLEKERKEQYIERLKKYYKRYGQKYVHTHGFWRDR